MILFKYFFLFLKEIFDNLTDLILPTYSSLYQKPKVLPRKERKTYIPTTYSRLKNQLFSWRDRQVWNSKHFDVWYVYVAALVVKL